ncbi:MAG: DNA-directed RNA polymerase subunit RpoH/Rpb5 C-terminal domain-containing protein [Candidatus Bilamarchaeaceae archaeon]
MKGKKKKKASTINIWEHELVPKMEILPEGEVKTLLKKFGIESTEKLPKMKDDDPAAIALGAEKGAVIRIKREDPSGKYDYYRVVV